MSDFLEARLNDGLIVFGTTGGPTWKTSITQTNNGHEQRNAVWSYPMSMYDFNDRMMLDDEASAFNQFFNAVQGSAVGFRFKDWLDYNDAGNGVVVRSVSTLGVASYQIFKAYTVGSRTVQRKISKPVASSVKVYVDGVLTTASVDGTSGSVSLSDGAITSDTVLTWTGEFDVPVRFDSDSLQMTFSSGTQEGFGVLGVKAFNLKGLKIMELKL
jgi:uncharacterized protein (TIGR02217 family)